MSDGAPQVNGPTSPTGKYIDTIDPECEDYQKNLRRPADVKEDMKQMEDRSRVSLILNSEAFRRELEDIIDEQIRTGNHPASLLALQQISDLLLPNAAKFPQGYINRGTSPVIPVADIKGTESMGFSKGEKMLRCRVAACYRLVDLMGWSHGIYNHISARVSQEHEHFLLNPFGLAYSEVTASSLIKVDMQGEVVDPGSTTLGVNRAGFAIHSAIHQFRPDIKCIIHLHTPTAIAVSSMKCGLLPLSQEALICGEVSYLDYNGIHVDQEEKEKLQRSLGPINKLMFLRNHGILACGNTVEEAYHYAFNVIAACDTQTRAIPAGLDNLILVDAEIQKKTFSVASQGGGGVDTSKRKWKTGELEFEAAMRQLDNCGYRTGYNYKQPVVKREVRRDRSNSEVEVPPSSSSFTYVFDGDVEHSKYVSPIKQALERQKQQHKVGWLNSPNTYVKQEIDETGTQHPKKITKWVKDDGEESPRRATSTPIKVESPNQFAPQGSDPREFKHKQKQIKKDYYEERVSAGPSSKVLDGISWDEAERLKQSEGPDGSLSATGDSVIVIGAASKGIIQRDQQNNAQVYKTRYATNPFEAMTEDEIERYKFEVETRGQPIIEEAEEPLEPGPDGVLISTEERLQSLQQKPTEGAPDAGVQIEISEDGRGDGYRVNAKPVVRKKKTSETNIDDVSPASPVSPTTPTAPVVRRAVRASAPPVMERRKSRETMIDDIVDAPPARASVSSRTSDHSQPEPKFQRSESARYPPKSPELVDELKKRNFDRSKSDRKPKKSKEKAMNGDEEQARSPAKSDTLKSTDSASGGEYLEDRSSKEGSPTKEHPSPTKEKKKKKKFRMPSFSKTKKNKDSKESAI